MTDGRIFDYPDLWQYLAGAGKPVVLYGMGDGADKVISALGRVGVIPSAVFASDEFVRGQYFHDMRVMKYSEIKEAFGNPIILVSFASALPDVKKRIIKIAEECELYIPDVPVVGGELYNGDFEKNNAGRLDRIREMLCDDYSRALFDDMRIYKRYGTVEQLFRRTYDSLCEMMTEKLETSNVTDALDLGAYTGDTASDMARVFPKLRRLTALEPDPHSFRRLSENVRNLSVSYPDLTVSSYNYAAWSCDTILDFKKGGSRSSKLGCGSKTVQVRACSCDGLLGGEKLDFAKMDVEGAEREALIGMEKMISSEKPALCVSVYHKSRDLFELCEQISALCNSYKFSLSRLDCFPAWDLYLWAT